MSDTQRRRGQAVKAGLWPPRLRGAQAAFTAWHRCCTLATSFEGWGVFPSAGVEGAPSGGRTGHPPARPGRSSARPTGVGGGQHHIQRGTRLTRTLVVTAPAVTTHTNGCFSVWRLATAVAEPWATRAGQGAQDITGVACSGATKQSFSGSLWPRYMQQPVMLSWPSANLPRRPCQAGAGSMPGLACNTLPCATRAMR